MFISSVFISSCAAISFVGIERWKSLITTPYGFSCFKWYVRCTSLWGEDQVSKGCPFLSNDFNHRLVIADYIVAGLGSSTSCFLSEDFISFVVLTICNLYKRELPLVFQLLFGVDFVSSLWRLDIDVYSLLLPIHSFLHLRYFRCNN